MTSKTLAALAAAGAAFVFSGCAAPDPVHENRSGDLVHEEDGIRGIVFGADTLDAVTLPGDVTSAAVELPPFAASKAFDRVGVRWDSRDAGGATRVEVSVDGAEDWLPVHEDFAETVGESGLTLHAGHLDVPAGSRSLRARVRLTRLTGDALSPRVPFLAIDTFVRAEIAQTGEPVTAEPDAHADALDEDALPGAIGAGPDGPVMFDQPAVVSREEWGARAPACLEAAQTPWRMTFHHTVTPNGDWGETARSRMRQMQAYHMDTQGWCDIGYHFAVDAAGTIYRGRTTTGRIGTHVAWHNDGNIGISLMGTYSSAQAPDAQLAGLEDAFAWLGEYWGIAIDGNAIRGHREWSNQSTSCPGDTVLARKGEIVQGVWDRLFGGGGGGGGGSTGGDAVLSDNGTGDFWASEAWWTSTYWPGFHGADYAGRDVTQGSDPAYWAASLNDGNYEVFVRYSSAHNRASAAPYFVYHANGTTKVFVDQRHGGGEWVSIGTYWFGGGWDWRVALSCWTSSGEYVIADAVLFEPR